jgi:hypothetical protein
MSTLTITLPESLQKFVTDQVMEQGLTEDVLNLYKITE